MAGEPPIRYEHDSSPFRFAYFDGWNLREEDGTVSVWRSEEGGAITISCFLHRDPEHVANAFEHAKRFSEKTALGPFQVTGNPSVAESIFNVPEGGFCKARVIARGPRVVLATYNASRENPEEERQAHSILASVSIASPPAGPLGGRGPGGPVPYLEPRT